MGILSPLLYDIAASCEVVFPRMCLVCTRPLRGRSLCFRCTPRRDLHEYRSSGRCLCCFGPHLATPGNAVCEACRLFPLPTNQIRYLWEYGDLARDLIRAMKYRPSVYLARLSGEWVAEAIPTLFDSPSWDFVVAIPSSPQMLLKRLFHPTEEIARPIVKRHGGVLVSGILRHTKDRAPQATLSHRERLEGLKRLFSVRRPDRVRNRRILLVEDVVTTGATIQAATHLLLSHGAASVDIVALAQTNVWRRFRRRLFEIFG